MRLEAKRLNIKLIIFEVVMLASSLIIIVPLLIMLMGSFKNQAEAVRFNIALPSRWQFDNYSYVFNEGGIAKAMKNSIIITFISVAVTVIFSSLCSFILARKKTRYSNNVYSLFLMGMVAPMQVLTTFGLLKLLHIMGTYFAVIMVFTAIQIPWSVFITTSFIKSIPREMDEAAFIDGAKPFTMFFAVILPLLKPVIATVVVMDAMSVWNDFMVPLYFFNTADKLTMPLTVYNFFGQYFSNWNYVFADLVLTALPVTILYLFCQKYIVSGITAGAIKG